MKRVPILVGAAIIAVALVPWLLLWSSLPDPVASHFDFRGHADGHLAPVVLMIALGGVAAVLAVSAAFSAREVTALPRLVSGAPILAFVASVLAVSSLASVLANRDESSWESARLSVVWLGIAGMCGVGAALAIAAVQTTSESAGRSRAAPLPAVGFGPTERVAWVGRSSSRLFVVIAAVLAVTGIVQIFTVSPAVGGIVLLSAAAVGAFFSVHVVINSAAVRVRGLLAWPRVTIPLDRIAAAEAIDVRPLAWGGWGCRGSLRLMRRAAWVVHGGPGLKLDLRDGKVFVVTVDGAEEAAAVVNGLIAT